MTVAKPANYPPLHLGQAWLRGKDDQFMYSKSPKIACCLSNRSKLEHFIRIATPQVCSEEMSFGGAAMLDNLQRAQLRNHATTREYIHMHSRLVSKSRIDSFKAICGVMWIASGFDLGGFLVSIMPYREPFSSWVKRSSLVLRQETRSNPQTLSFKRSESGLPLTRAH